MTFSSIPAILLALSSFGSIDKIAEIAGATEPREADKKNQVEVGRISVEQEFARFTNAVIFIDYPDSRRSLYRLSRVASNRWQTVARVDGFLAQSRNINYLTQMECAARKSGDFKGLCDNNTILIYIPKGVPHKTLHNPKNEPIAFFKGYRRDITIEMESMGMEEYFLHPEQNKKKNNQTVRRLRLAHRDLWVARGVIGDADNRAEVWMFDYRLPSTMDEIREELRAIRTDPNFKRTNPSFNFSFYPIEN